ncbi:MAG TPA: ATP-binding cassette domain-containing protein [Candidatus Bathyarchaeia archaeon]|nr:ATP-binding cassette domain-containing protein [Candidatus Bathyarchaeia archaeon]
MTHLLSAHSLQVEYLTNQGCLRLYDNGISFEMQTGDFLAVLGGSGWGKSTLVNVVLGLERPTSGTLHLKARDVTASSFVKRCALTKIAAVFQRPTSLSGMTVLQNLRLALSLAGIPRKEREGRIRESLGFFGLEGIWNNYPEHLSAGQRRRIDLARAVAIRPELLVLDEPTCDLDSSATNLVMPLLRGLNKEHGTSIFMTTAIPRQATSATRSFHLTPPTLLTSANRTA